MKLMDLRENCKKDGRIIELKTQFKPVYETIIMNRIRQPTFDKENRNKKNNTESTDKKNRLIYKEKTAIVYM
jgi:hypothetical protein